MEKKDQENICVWCADNDRLKNLDLQHIWYKPQHGYLVLLDWIESISDRITWNMEVRNIPDLMLYQFSLACLPIPAQEFLINHLIFNDCSKIPHLQRTRLITTSNGTFLLLN